MPTPTLAMLAEKRRREEIGRRVHEMSYADKVAYLKAAGWRREGKDCWRDPESIAELTLQRATRAQVEQEIVTGKGRQQ